MAARRSHSRRRQPLTFAPTVRFTCVGKSESQDPAVSSSGKTPAWRYAGVVTRRTNLFVMAVIVEQGSVPRNSQAVQVEGQWTWYYSRVYSSPIIFRNAATTCGSK